MVKKVPTEWCIQMFSLVFPSNYFKDRSKYPTFYVKCHPRSATADRALNGVFPLADSYADSNSYSNNMQKGSTGTDSDGHSDAKSQWKLVKFHLISTDISVKLCTVPICIRIGIGIGSVETVLDIIILAIWIRIGIGIGVWQWKHAITVDVQYIFIKILGNLRYRTT